jgi:GNAT superfamily N-acetyltransferase
MSEVRRITERDVDELARVLARAFEDDPLSGYMFPSDRARLGRLRRFFRLQLTAVFLPRGEGYTTDAIEGGALWVPPVHGRPQLSDVVTQLRLAALVGRRMPAAGRLIALLGSRHPRSQHYYLGTLGTEPARQGHGIGSALLAPVLERCDAEGIPAYLESSKERNVPFYARHGFVVTEELQVPSGGPRLWLMWREPRDSWQSR